MTKRFSRKNMCREYTKINPLNAELNPIRHLLALVGARHIVHVSRVRANIVTIIVIVIVTVNASCLGCWFWRWCMYRISFHIRCCKSFPCTGLDRVQTRRISRQSAKQCGIRRCSYYNNNKKKKKKKTSEKHTWKTRHQGTTANNHTVHCAHTSKSTNVEAQSITFCNYRTAATLCTVETWFLPGT